MYKSNIIIILILCAAIFTYAAPLNMTPGQPSSSLTSRSAKPINYNSNNGLSGSSVYKRRALVNPELDLSESEIDKQSMVKGRLMIKRDPIGYTGGDHPKYQILRAQKKARRSIVRSIDDNKLKRNEK